MLALNTPDPEKVTMGIRKLLSNAVEHGNVVEAMILVPKEDCGASP